ncbi:LuxR C-terminal-related transcriptional regulator [Enterobacter quasiroggenkampii]|nr:LuxR C-terminal-related transcriptional regulator [Enterobacter quasiroggenkampii]
MVLSISDKDIMLNILACIMLHKPLAIFIQPLQWPSRARVFCMCNVFILPGRMCMVHLLTVIRKCLLSTSGVFRINLERVKSSEWSAMLYLMSGISNRHLAQMLNASEKTISGRVKSLAIKMGLSGLNKATQLNAMNFFYDIYTSRKSTEERNYFKKQQALVSESVKNWSITV